MIPIEKLNSLRFKSVNSKIPCDYVVWYYESDNIIYTVPFCKDFKKGKEDIGVWRLKELK